MNDSKCIQLSFLYNISPQNAIIENPPIHITEITRTKHKTGCISASAVQISKYHTFLRSSGQDASFETTQNQIKTTLVLIHFQILFSEIFQSTPRIFLVVRINLTIARDASCRFAGFIDRFFECFFITFGLFLLIWQFKILKLCMKKAPFLSEKLFLLLLFFQIPFFLFSQDFYFLSSNFHPVDVLQKLFQFRR